MAIEEPSYRVLESDGPIEVRNYQATLVAESVVDAGFEKAGNRAFRSLFNYISDNDIAMTAPVTQQADEKGWAVRFMMPGDYSLESLPEPAAGNVVIKAIPARQVAVIRYSGSWSGDNYRSHLDKLSSWVQENGLEITGDPVWARYNGPLTLWFLRRNEIQLPIRR